MRRLMMNSRIRPTLIVAAALLAAACAGSPRKERALLHELSLHAYDEGERFAEEGNYPVALDRFNRSMTISSRPASHFQAAKAYEALDDPESAAEQYLEALKMAPDYGQARLSLMALEFDVPSEIEIRTDPSSLEQFSRELGREVEIRRIAREEMDSGLTPEQIHAQRQRLRHRLERAAAERMPTLSEVRTVLFAAQDEDERLPSATDPIYPTDASIILNQYAYHFANGVRLQKLNHFEKAVHEYGLALNDEPDRVEARLNLDERRDVLTVLCRVDQRLDDRRVLRHPI